MTKEEITEIEYNAIVDVVKRVAELEAENSELREIIKSLNSMYKERVSQ